MPRHTLAFALGVAVALGLGWFAFPRALYIHQQQPVEFAHRIHAATSGISQCSDCHSLRQDGVFEGIPPIGACAGCHTAQLGSSKSEAALVNSYIKEGREVPWLKNYQQPANVWFSHGIHIRLAGLKCSDCHGTFGDSGLQPYAVDRLSGYSRRILDMSDCQDCHHKRHLEVSCLGCHQ
jgi:menaquinone reductase, multiheme cytochrome c subunit